MIPENELPAIFHAYHNAQITKLTSAYIYPPFISINSKEMVLELQCRKNGNSWFYEIKDCQILLKSLENINDEDAIEVAKMAMYHPSSKENWDNIICSFIVDEIKRLSNSVMIISSLICWEGSIIINYDGTVEIKNEDGDLENGSIWNNIGIADFLRSKSYNIGYGKYSPDDLIQDGIVKIIN